MPSVKEIRDRAKRAFKSRYWAAVGLLGLIALVLNLWQLTPLPYTVLGLLMIVLIGLVLTQGSLNIGLNLAKGMHLDMNTAFFPFERYGHNLGGSLWYCLFMFLWALIAVVPYLIAGIIAMMNYVFHSYFLYGFYDFDYFDLQSVFSDVMEVMAVPIIIFASCLAVIAIFKSLQYFCARYLLLDCPKVAAVNILNLSKTMMKGEKKKLFILAVTVLFPYYILLILSVIFSSVSSFMSIAGENYYTASGLSTAGIVLSVAAIAVSVFYYQPYAQAAFGIFYYEVKKKALADGRITYADLGEIPPIASNQQIYIELN